eukprot:SAG11_NODE_479_length_9108_cov_3.699856_8_plen_83_part_00
MLHDVINKDNDDGTALSILQTDMNSFIAATNQKIEATLTAIEGLKRDITSITMPGEFDGKSSSLMRRSRDEENRASVKFERG